MTLKSGVELNMCTVLGAVRGNSAMALLSAEQALVERHVCNVRLDEPRLAFGSTQL